MSDEDFDPFVGGPPPDPSERTWRHPSEVAAQANADAMAARQRSARRFRLDRGVWARGRPLGLLLAGSLGAAACLTLVAVVGLGDSSDSVLDPSAIGASDVVGLPPLGGGEPGQNALATTTPTTGVSSIASSSTTVAATVTSLAPDPDVAIAAETRVAAIIPGSGQIASGVVLDGYVVTSASAVGDELSITISGSQAISGLAYLVGIDPFSDLAVYRPSIGSRSAGAWTSISLRVFDTDGLPLTTGESETGNETGDMIGEGDPVVLASATPTGHVIDSGMIIALDSDGETPTGQPLVGLIDTSIRRPNGGSGGLLLSDDGAPVGIVVHTASSLASAVPIDDARLIAQRLTEQGWANQSWLGFVGIDLDDGVEVVDVVDGGPAAVGGLRPGDVIAFLDGSPIDHMGGVTAALRRAEPGDAVVMVVERNGEFVSVRVIAEAYTETLTEPVGG